MSASQASAAAPQHSSVHAPLSRSDVSAFTSVHRALLVIGNASLLIVLAFSCWVLGFRSVSVQETALPAFFVLAVPFNVATISWLVAAIRQARNGQKIVITGKVDRVEAGPADDETSVRIIHLGEERFRIPV